MAIRCGTAKYTKCPCKYMAPQWHKKPNLTLNFLQIVIKKNSALNVLLIKYTYEPPNNINTSELFPKFYTFECRYNILIKNFNV